MNARITDERLSEICARPKTLGIDEETWKLAMELRAARTLEGHTAKEPWDEIAEAQARSKAASLLRKNGWKAGDNLSLHSVMCLMVDFAKRANKITDRCGYPDCGCDFDARCTAALSGDAS